MTTESPVSWPSAACPNGNWRRSCLVQATNPTKTMKLRRACAILWVGWLGGIGRRVLAFGPSLIP
jgi:hypothetical protein